MTPSISIVVPTWNRVELLERGVESVLGQDDGDFELVVVDDRSTDGTWDFLASLRDPRLRVLRNETRLGMCANHNRAIQESRGGYVYVLQDDDLAEPGLVRRVRQSFAANPDVELLIFTTVLVDAEDGSPRQLWAPDRQEVVEPPAGLLRFAAEWRISITQVVFARRLFDRLGGFDPELPIMSDAEMILRWLVQARSLLLPEPLARRRLWPGQYTSLTSESQEMADTMAGLAARVEAAAVAGGVEGPALEALRTSLQATFVEPYRLAGSNQPGGSRPSLMAVARKWLLR